MRNQIIQRQNCVRGALCKFAQVSCAVRIVRLCGVRMRVRRVRTPHACGEHVNVHNMPHVHRVKVCICM